MTSRTIKISSKPSALAIDANAGRVVIVSWDGYVDVLDTTDGSLVQTTHFPGNHFITVAVSARTARSFAGNLTNEISMLATESGRLLETIPVAAGPWQIVVDETRGQVYVVSLGDPPNGALSILDATSGQILHVVQMGRFSSALGLDEQRGHVFIANTHDKTVSIVDVRAGVLLDTVSVPSMPHTIAVCEAVQRAFVVSSDGLVALDTHTGKIVRTLTTQDIWGVAQAKWGLARGITAVDETMQRLFIVARLGKETDPGYIAIVNARTMTAEARVTVGPVPMVVVVHQHTHQAFILNSNISLAGPGVPLGYGTVSVLDAQVHMVVDTIEVGKYPKDLAVSPKNGLVFVANYGDGTVSVLDFGDVML